MPEMTRRCERCARELSGRQRRWCSDACRSAGRRGTVLVPVPDSARARFLAQFDGVTFQPWEQPLVEAAAATAATIEGLESLGADVPIQVTRELRQQRLALRTLLSGIRWPDHDASGSEWGRAMARRRWRDRSG